MSGAVEARDRPTDDDAFQACLECLESGGTVPRCAAEFVAGLPPTERELAKKQFSAIVALGPLDRGEAPARVGRRAWELLAEVPEEPDWIIPNLVARGWTLKIAGREKVGKGTLISSLLGALERGESSVFGEAAAEPITALIYTEEPDDSMREKVEHAGLRCATVVHSWELRGLRWPTWEAQVAELVARAIEDGHGVIFVDNISRAAGVEDESGVELARRAEVLFTAAQAQGLTVIVDHHHRKGAGRLEDMSRGGTAFAGACDVNVEIVRAGPWDSRARKISARGRLSSTIWEMTIELAGDGRSYDLIAGADALQGSEERWRLGELQALGEQGATVAEYMLLIDRSEDTARRTLEEFVTAGRARKDSGRPARYYAVGGGSLGF